MLLTERAIRQLIYNILLEGVREDADALRALLTDAPDVLRKFEPLSMKPKWVNWLADRYVRNKYPADDKLQDALPVVAAFAAADAAISQKYGSNPQFKAAVDNSFPPSERKWKNPADATSMSTTDMDTLLTLHKRPKDKIKIDRADKSWERDEIGTFGPWKLYFPRNQQNSINIAGVDPVTHEPYTTWCTGRTSGSNLFNNYAAHGTMLFYAINTEVTLKDPKDREGEGRICLGFLDGKLDVSGEYGGITVDAKNRGLKDADLARIFGGHTGSIIARAEAVVAELGGKHPVQGEIAAATKDPDKFSSMFQGLSDTEANDLFGHFSLDNFSPAVASVAANHKSAFIRSEIATSKNLPESMVIKLAGDAHSHVRATVAGRDDLPESLLMQLAGDFDADTRSAVARRDDLPESLLTKLANERDIDVRRAVAQRRDLPESLLMKLANDRDTEVRMAVAGRRDLPESLLLQLAGDPVGGVRAAVAKRPNLPESLLMKLVEDVPQVRVAVASRQDLPESLLMKLFRGDDLNVKVVLLHRRDLPESLLMALADEPDAAVRRSLASRRGIMSVPLLTKLADDSDSGVRKAVAHQLHLPEPLLIKLAGDSSLDVRNAILSRPNLPESAYLRFAKDANPDVRVAIASNYNLPESAAIKLAMDADKNVRFALARNYNLIPRLVIKLASDADVDVRRAVSWRGNLHVLPEPVLMKLATDPDSEVREYIAKNRHLSKSVRDAAAREPEKRDVTESRRLAYRILREIKRAERN